MKIKILLFAITLLFISKVNAQALTASDFLKTSGTVIRKNSGTGAVVNLRGTNLGSWLSMEYWMCPMGTGSLNRSQWVASAPTTFAGTNLQSVFDRDLSTRWSNGAAQVPNGSQYFTVDMSKNVIFNRISIETGNFTGDYPRGYTIEVSENGTTWETAATGTGTTANIYIQLPNIYFKRYVRVTQTGTATANYWSIAEFNLYMEDDFSVRNSLIDRFGVAGSDAVLDYYQNKWITTTDLDNIKNMGMNMVRVPFYWMEIMNNDGTIKTNGFTQLDWVIAQCTARGMYVILDLHGGPGGINGFITSGQAVVNNYWTDTTAQQRTINLWKAIANRYKTNPAVAAYDLLNEPLSSNQALYPIHQFYNTLYQEVRAIDADHIISIGAFPGFSFVVPPTTYGWTNVLYQIHNYNEDKLNYASQNGFIDAVLLDVANHQHNWNVPVLAGEFNFWNFPDLWQKYLRGLNALNASWSNWAYKTKRVDSPVENWGYYQNNTNPAPDIHYDSQTTMQSKWNLFTTSNFQANTALINLVSAYTTVATSVPPVGRTIWLKGNNDKYVSSEGNDNPMTCTRTTYGGWELFTIVDAGGGKIALKGSNNLYVSSQNGTAAMICNKTAIGETEKFTFINIGDWKVALRGTNGKYVNSENGSNPMMCDKPEIAVWESFTWGDGISGAKIGQTSTIHGFFAGKDVEIAPNPASGSINLKTGLNNYRIEIYNTNGTLVITKDNVNDTDSISTKELQAGTYVIKITGQGKSTSKKLIVK
ncbi:cellulase family glycosylhydrolase [Flavobacterium subsaxonicum]|uniref:cellulase family glycosylhydrolase n=1 Tax=Flavobacterium subsaxonicum TaxID=426226 RepID=UPI000428215C|nr:cellulase family glycosylhydrolase [Flavobacterium subsaxonicum]